jgi:hypothetical protein
MGCSCSAEDSDQQPDQRRFTVDGDGFAEQLAAAAVDDHPRPMTPGRSFDQVFPGVLRRSVSGVNSNHNHGSAPRRVTIASPAELETSVASTRPRGAGESTTAQDRSPGRRPLGHNETHHLPSTTLAPAGASSPLVAFLGLHPVNPLAEPPQSPEPPSTFPDGSLAASGTAGHPNPPTLTHQHLERPPRAQSSPGNGLQSPLGPRVAHTPHAPLARTPSKQRSFTTRRCSPSSTDPATSRSPGLTHRLLQELQQSIERVEHTDSGHNFITPSGFSGSCSGPLARRISMWLGDPPRGSAYGSWRTVGEDDVAMPLPPAHEAQHDEFGDVADSPVMHVLVGDLRDLASSRRPRGDGAQPHRQHHWLDGPPRSPAAAGGDAPAVAPTPTTIVASAASPNGPGQRSEL